MLMGLKRFLKTCTRILPDSIYVRLDFIRNLHRIPNLRTPVTFNEKLQWLKLYNHDPAYTGMADKLLMREYVRRHAEEAGTVPVLGVWDRFDDIDFNSLPDRFVLKCNHDSGCYVICRDKKSLDLEEARRTIEESLGMNYYYCYREWVYKGIVPRVFAEEYLEPNEGQFLWDYKFFCFNGEPRIMYMEKEASEQKTEAFFDMEGRFLDLEMDDPRPDTPPELPDCFDKMKNIAKKLSKGIPFLRVDLFFAGGKIYVGELTFFHCSGLGPVRPEKWNRILGSWIVLPEKKKI